MNRIEIFYAATIAIAAMVWVYYDAVAHQRRRLWALGALINAPVFFPLYFWVRKPDFYWSCPGCSRPNRHWTRHCPRCETVVPAINMNARLFGFWNEADAVAIFLLAQGLLLPLPLLLGMDLGAEASPEPGKYWLVQMVYVNLILLLCLYCVTGRYRRSLGDLGLRWRRWHVWIPLGIVVGIGLVIIQNTITGLIAWVGSQVQWDLADHFKQEMEGQRQTWPADLRDPLMFVVVFVAGILVPFSEEVLVRGIGYKALRARLGPRAGIVLTSLVFAFLHQAPAFFVALFAVGLILNYLYERTDSLVPSIMAHATLNTIAILAGIQASQAI